MTDDKESTLYTMRKIFIASLKWANNDELILYYNEIILPITDRLIAMEQDYNNYKKLGVLYNKDKETIMQQTTQLTTTLEQYTTWVINNAKARRISIDSNFFKYIIFIIQLLLSWKRKLLLNY